MLSSPFATNKSFGRLMLPWRDVELRKALVEVRPLKVTWGRDLSKWVKKIRKCISMIKENLCQFSRRYASRFFFLQSSKNVQGRGGGVGCPTPPPPPPHPVVARVNQGPNEIWSPGIVWWPTNLAFKCRRPLSLPTYSWINGYIYNLYLLISWRMHLYR